jgi:hypothetical protein
MRCNQAVDPANVLYSPGGDVVCAACHQAYSKHEKDAGDTRDTYYFFRADTGPALGGARRTVIVSVLGGAFLGAAVLERIYHSLLPGPHGGQGGGPAGAALGFISGACLGTGVAAQILHAKRGGPMPSRVQRLVTRTRVAAFVLGVLPLVSALAS